MPPEGSPSANVDSPQQGLFGLKCSDVQKNGPALTFSVPNVCEEWTGVLSADHHTLSGVWKQGNTTSDLVFTRGVESTQLHAPSASNADLLVGAKSPAGISGSQGTPCTTMMGATYWDGSAWKTMMMAAHLGRENSVSIAEGVKALGRNPFNSRAGVTQVLIFKNSAAALTLGSGPKFCVSIPPNIDPTVVMIGSVEAKKDHRELETCAGPCASKGRNSDGWMPQKRVQSVDIKRISDNALEITPKRPLPPGQYILGGPPMLGYYDFGVGGADSGN